MKAVITAPDFEFQHDQPSELSDIPKIQYLEICNAETLVPTKTLTPGTIIAIAVFIKEVRLIDNWIVGTPLPEI